MPNGWQTQALRVGKGGQQAERTQWESRNGRAMGVNIKGLGVRCHGDHDGVA